MNEIAHSHLKGLIPATDVTRRTFVMTSLATGFAVAAGPVTAETIRTDAKGLVAGEVKIPAKDGWKRLNAFLKANGAS